MSAATQDLDRPVQPGRWRDLLAASAALGACWQAASIATGSPALVSLDIVLGRVVALAGSPVFWGHAAATGAAAAIALVLSVAGGLSLGLLLGASRFAGEVAEPLLVGVHSLPKITLYPLVLLFFGLGLEAKVALGVLHALVPIALIVMRAVWSFPPVLLRAARSMRLSRWVMIRAVFAPAVMPEAVAGLRIGASLTVLGVLIGELFASQRGLGFLISNAASLNDMATVLAIMLLITGAAVAANMGLLRAEHWVRHPSQGCLSPP